jgi:hypothetical protein
METDPPITGIALDPFRSLAEAMPALFQFEDLSGQALASATIQRL